MSLDLLQNLLKELGHSIKLPDLSADSEGYCCLSFDDKITVHIQLDKDTHNLTFFAELGLVNAEQRRSVYEKMLEANVFWLGTSGATLGVNTDTMKATIGYQEPIQGVDFQRFHQLLEGFVNTTEKWIDLLAEIQANASVDSPSSSTGPALSGTPEGFIAV
jgi:hypothetical protein